MAIEAIAPIGADGGAAPRGVGPSDELTYEEQRRLADLARRDRAVRLHEQAHMTAAGSYAKGGPTYRLVIGPDGKQYAVSGEVLLDTATIPGRLGETIAKMHIIRRAALAPADPSAQDRHVAAQAAMTEAQARRLQQAVGGATVVACSSDPAGYLASPEPPQPAGLDVAA